MINLLQSMEWSKLLWEESCKDIVSIKSILPKMDSVYEVSLDKKEQVLNKIIAHILWMPPHSELNSWRDRPWEILDSYIITGTLVQKEENSCEYDFKVAKVDLFTSCLLSSGFEYQSKLPTYTTLDGLTVSVFSEITNAEVFSIGDLIYLCGTHTESFYELVFTEKYGRLILLYSAATPYAGYYANIFKCKLSDEDNKFFKKVIESANVIEDKRCINLKLGYVKGAEWM